MWGNHRQLLPIFRALRVYSLGAGGAACKGGARRGCVVLEAWFGVLCGSKVSEHSPATEGLLEEYLKPSVYYYSQALTRPGKMKDDLNYPNQCLSQSSRKGVRHLRFGWMHMMLLEQ